MKKTGLPDKSGGDEVEYILEACGITRKFQPFLDIMHCLSRGS
ncbi:MAG: hypothetical protein AAGA53_15010 [Pseudomonadota bacterium]